MIRSVKLVGEPLEFGRRCLSASERAAHLATNDIPRGAMQELGAWVTPALARQNEDIATAERVLESFERAERVVPPIDTPLVAEHEAAPRPADYI